MKTSNIVAVIVGLFLFFSLFGSNFTVKQKAPDYAIVYVDPEKKIYYAPPYIDNLSPAARLAENIDIKTLTRSTLKEVRNSQYTLNEVSKEKGYFSQEYRTLVAFSLEKLGLLKPLPSRWNNDGSWNY